jgi:DeoR/GlpR family transcriptional regulator of sugar metabolism
MKKLLREERQSRILQEVQAHRQATAVELSQIFGVSEITIRRDLREMADEGLVRRTHGGAVTVQSSQSEPPVLQRMTYNQEYKKNIGRVAAGLVNDGETIFIGSGTTTSYLARNLRGKKNLTVVTNALNIGMELATADGISVVVIGGMLRASELSMIGHIAEIALQEVRMDKVIIGIPAIHLEAGLSNDFLPEVMTDRALLSMAREIILIADHTKFGKVCSAYLAPITAISTLVTDPMTDQETLDKIRSMSVNVIVAEKESPMTGKVAFFPSAGSADI